MKKIILNSMFVVAAVAMVSCGSKKTTKQEEVVVALPKIEVQTVTSRMVAQEGYFTGPSYHDKEPDELREDGL